MIPEFDLTIPGFSLQNAQACYWAAAMAYDAPTISSARAHCFIHPGPGYILFAFQGTKDILDFLTDAEAWFQPTPYGLVHHGFRESLDSLNDQLTPWLEHLAESGSGVPPLNPDRGGTPLPQSLHYFITGHSKGGAEAELFAHDLACLGVPANRIHLYTFGQPRTGNADWRQSCAEKLPGRHWRFVNRADIVPRLAGWLYGYRHSGVEAFHPLFSGQPSFNTPLWLKLITDAVVLYQEWRQGRVALLNDHHVALYGAWLNSIANLSCPGSTRAPACCQSAPAMAPTFAPATGPDPAANTLPRAGDSAPAGAIPNHPD